MRFDSALLRFDSAIYSAKLSSTMSDDEYMKTLEIQRRNFEAQFGSLETMGFEDKSKKTSNGEESGENTGNESDELDELQMSDDFGGFSGSELELESEEESEEEEVEEEEEKPKPKVFKLEDNYTSAPILSKKEQRQIRSGRAPTITELEEKQRKLDKITAKQAQQGKKEDEENLENDVQLQRLLQESHILANNKDYSGADLTMQTIDYEEPTGKARKKALTSRLRNLSTTNSSTDGQPAKLEKMPMSMRKGMIRSRERKIQKYEQEAKDAGIVLSKVKKGQLRDLNSGKGATFASDRLGNGKKDVRRVRDRGLKINSVGKSTRNGLVISSKDINRINKKRR